MDSDALMLKIAKQFGIRLIDVTKNTECVEANGIETYENRSFIIGRDEIQLGVYNDPELKFLSFFHEIGHILVGNKFEKDAAYNKHKIEERAWEKGYELAASYNVVFSDKAKQWAVSELNTYIEKKEEENGPI